MEPISLLVLLLLMMMMMQLHLLHVNTRELLLLLVPLLLVHLQIMLDLEFLKKQSCHARIVTAAISHRPVAHWRQR